MEPEEQVEELFYYYYEDYLLQEYFAFVKIMELMMFTLAI